MKLTITVQNPEMPIQKLLKHTRISGVTILFEDGAFLAVKKGEVVARFEGTDFEVKNRNPSESVIFQHARPKEYWTLQRETGE